MTKHDEIYCSTENGKNLKPLQSWDDGQQSLASFTIVNCDRRHLIIVIIITVIVIIIIIVIVIIIIIVIVMHCHYTSEMML